MQLLVLASALLALGTDGGCAAPPPPGMAPPAEESPLVELPAQVSSPSLALQLNLPAYRLDVFMDGARHASYPVAIGMRTYKTPIGDFEIFSVEWNPWWIPPNSAWARKEKVTPPGADNPMGRVKLNWASLYFLHGTPVPRSIGYAQSHGCVRMHNADAISLALLVMRAGAPLLDSATVEAMGSDTVTTRTVTLDTRIPLQITYELLEWRDDSLWVYPDVYRRGAATIQRALEVIESAGQDTTLIRRNVLRSVVARGRRTRMVVPGDSLFRVRPASLYGLP